MVQYGCREVLAIDLDDLLEDWLKLNGWWVQVIFVTFTFSFSYKFLNNEASSFKNKI